jgi:hypothetical protein
MMDIQFKIGPLYINWKIPSFKIVRGEIDLAIKVGNTLPKGISY